VAFKVMTGSAQQAKQTLGMLRDFAASTPFQLQGLISASQKLLGFGVTADQLQSKLRFLGDIAAGAGMQVADLAQIFGKIKAKGKAMTEEIMQMADRGIPIIDVLAKSLGVTGAEILKMAETGQLSFDLIEGAMQNMAAEGGVYNGMMQQQSETTAGKISTLKDKFLEMAGAIAEKLKPHLDALIAWFSDAIDWVTSLDESTVDMIVTMAKWAAGVIAAIVVIRKVGAVLKWLRGIYQMITAAQIVQQAMSGPKGWATLAAGAAIAGGALLAFNAMQNDVNATMEKSEQALQKENAAIEASGAAKKNNLAMIHKQSQAEQKAAKAKEEAEKAAKKAAEERAKAVEDMVKKGEQLTAAMRTPQETFQDRIMELEEMVQEGVISWQTYERAVAKAMKTLKQSKKVEDKKESPVGAVTRGSTAAFSAIEKSRKEQERMRKLDEERNRELVRLRAVMSGIELNTDVDNVNVVNF